MVVLDGSYDSPQLCLFCSIWIDSLAHLLMLVQVLLQSCTSCERINRTTAALDGKPVAWLQQIHIF